MTFETAAEAIVHITSTEPMFSVGEADIRGVRLKVFDKAPEHLRAILQLSAQEHGDKDFLVYENQRYSFADFETEVNRLAQSLRSSYGIKPGDKVAICMRNYPEYMIAMMAIISIGAVVVFLNSWWTSEELTYGFEDSGARLVFADAPRADAMTPFAERIGLSIILVRGEVVSGMRTYADLVASAPSQAAPDLEIDPDADFAVMYTSGSTGHPKGVVQTHRGAISAVFSWLMGGLVREAMGNGVTMPTDRNGVDVQPAMLLTTPMFHVSATHACFLVSLAAGGRLILMHKWDADAAIDLIERENVARFFGVPTMSAELMEAAIRSGKSLPTLRSLEAGGAKRPAAQVGKLVKAMPHAEPATGFGMTETNALGIGIRGRDYIDRPGAAGRLYPPLQELKIVDDDDNIVPNGQVGELAIRSSANMRCYLNKPEATAEALRDGWLYTGDLATVDDEGIVTIVDRKKDMIIRGGENISCLEVDAALHTHPDIAEAAVFSVPDERLGETVGAGVQLKAGAGLTEAALQGFLREQLSAFKVPERIWFRTDPLPRGGTEKTDRRALRKECLGDGVGASVLGD
jgi:acyl-CoA synthetase (AMP-forming)/AMP-acid ligase II